MSDNFRKAVFLLGIFIFTFIVIPWIGLSYLDQRVGENISGWFQVGIAAFTFPLIVYELDQIRQAVNRTPEIEIGVVSVESLPISNVRNLKLLPQNVSVTTGYPHFYIVLRNVGRAPAKYLKIHVEHINRNPDVFPPPRMKVSEFSEKKPTFVSENNFDFIFRSSTDWIINSGDVELFGFHATTPVVKSETNSAGVSYEVSEFPPLSNLIIVCNVWTDGLGKPVEKKLEVEIKERE